MIDEKIIEAIGKCLAEHAQSKEDLQADAERFRWLLSQPQQVFNQIHSSAHLALRSRMWTEGPNSTEYDDAFDAQVRIEIDKRRKQ